jgi:hypothetical protein
MKYKRYDKLIELSQDESLPDTSCVSKGEGESRGWEVIHASRGEFHMRHMLFLVPLWNEEQHVTRCRPEVKTGNAYG